MSDNRNKFQIMYDILIVIQNYSRISITKLVTKSNLTHTRIKSYLGDLEKRGYLQINKDCYEITPDGFSFIAEFRKVKDIIEAFEV
jgi:predicted transcriptional regulator